MSFKRILQAIAAISVLVAALGTTGNASAWYCNSTITVQWGDTLSGIAALCGTSVTAIQAANPGLGNWVYAGQVLYIPTGTTVNAVPIPSGTYVVQWGDTLAKIARRAGVSVNDILAANPTIYNASLIYVGQVLNVPSTPTYYTVQSGDTMRIIAAKYGTSVYSLQLLNPQIQNINWIYAGQIIRVY